MPLIVISGLPSSGKSNRALELKQFFEEKGRIVKLFSENVSVPKAGYNKNEYFADSQKEKIVRSDLKSEAIRFLNKENVIILDAGNYIKGYRYELFCATKAARTNQCTIFTAISQENAWEFNQTRSVIDTDSTNATETQNNSNIAYTKEIFDALCMRYEEPHDNCRWDSPLIVCLPEDKLDLEAIYHVLISSKPLPSNQSTQNAPLSSTNYLFDLDKITQDIVSDVNSARKIGILGEIPIKNSEIKIKIPDSVNLIQLNRLRRQFLNYSKMHNSSTSLDKVPQLFVQFLNSNFNK